MRVAYLNGRHEAADFDAAMQQVETAGCDRVVFEASPRGSQPGGREALESTVKRLAAGDVLVVISLDHLADDVAELIGLLDSLGARGITVETLSSVFDTGDAATAATIRSLSAFRQAVTSRQESLRRVQAGDAEAGRPRLMMASEIFRARELIEVHGRSIADVAREFGVSRATMYRSLKRV